MKTKSLISNYKSLALGITTLGVVVASSSAAITFDLRASGGTLGNVGDGGKSFTATSSSGTVVLEIWAQITLVGGNSANMGVQGIMGSIVSTSTPGTATGSVGTGVFPSIFNSNAQIGTQAALSTVADNITDLGSSSTSSTSTPQYVKPRKDSANGVGIVIGSTAYAALATPGVTGNLITNGIEIFMGSATLTLANFSAGTVTMNWVKPVVTSPANKGAIAAWTEDALVSKQGNTNNADMFYNPGVVITVGVPEPTSFAMLMMGSLGLVGFRRPSFRRSA